MTMLAIVAALGAAIFAGPANAAAAADAPAVNSTHRIAALTDACPAGRRWVSGHYSHWAVWHPGHCTRY
jgi:hypothetical protein